MRLLWGEDIGEVSREIRVAPPELERWRREFLEGGLQELKKKNRPGGELMPTRAKLGEMTMRVEFAGGVPRKKGVRGRVEEALEALGRVSPATRRPYPLTMVCETWRVARSSVYAARARPPESDRREPGKRGPKTALSDEELVEEIWTVLKASPFLGEGHRKVARLAARGIRATGRPHRPDQPQSDLVAPLELDLPWCHTVPDGSDSRGCLRFRGRPAPSDGDVKQHSFGSSRPTP